jgi:hypothetical protein
MAEAAVSTAAGLRSAAEAGTAGRARASELASANASARGFIFKDLFELDFG